MPRLGERLDDTEGVVHAHRGRARLSLSGQSRTATARIVSGAHVPECPDELKRSASAGLGAVLHGLPAQHSRCLALRHVQSTSGSSRQLLWRLFRNGAITLVPKNGFYAARTPNRLRTEYFAEFQAAQGAPTITALANLRRSNAAMRRKSAKRRREQPVRCS